eukprot:scaffold85465_cov19-Tisochrysis_lutea.AAC.1
MTFQLSLGTPGAPLQVHSRLLVARTQGSLTWGPHKEQQRLPHTEPSLHDVPGEQGHALSEQAYLSHQPSVRPLLALYTPIAPRLPSMAYHLLTSLFGCVLLQPAGLPSPVQRELQQLQAIKKKLQVSRRCIE